MRDRAAPLSLLAAIALAYASAFGAAFQFDDFHAVVDNPDVHGVAAWLASMPGIRPLTKLSFALSWTVAPAPASFVALSVVLHALAACLALGLARRWLRSLAPEVRAVGTASLVAAVVFALHPAQTEAVTYVAGRSVVLSGCLYLAALWAFERARDGDRPVAWTAASCAAFGLSLAARETAWTLPLAIVLLEAARGARLGDAIRRAWPQFGVLLLGAGAMLASGTYRRLLGQSLAFRDPVSNLAAQVDALAYAVTHPVLTLRVNFDPDVATSSPFDLAWWVGLAGLAMAVAVGFAALRRAPWLGVGLLWFLLHLVPTNGVVARFDLANDRHLYLALLGPGLVAGVIVARMRPAAVARVVAVALAAALGVATLVRNTDYRSEVALWEATTRASPRKARAWNNLGYAWELAGDPARARAAYGRALALDPGYPKALLNLDRLGGR